MQRKPYSLFFYIKKILFLMICYFTHFSHIYLLAFFMLVHQQLTIINNMTILLER